MCASTMRTASLTPTSTKATGPPAGGSPPRATIRKGYAAHHANCRQRHDLPFCGGAGKFSYTPRESMQALRHFLTDHGDELWGRYGFVDAFCEASELVPHDTFLAIDQGPILLMIENHRSGLLWKLFMSIPEVQAGLRRLDFKSPHLSPPAAL